MPLVRDQKPETGGNQRYTNETDAKSFLSKDKLASLNEANGEKPEGSQIAPSRKSQASQRTTTTMHDLASICASNTSKVRAYMDKANKARVKEMSK